MNIFDRLRAGEAVAFSDPDYMEISRACAETREKLLAVNKEHDADTIRERLNDIFVDKMPTSSFVVPPFFVNYGKNVRIAENVFINTSCTMLDLCGEIVIEEQVMIAPDVKLLTEGHPVEVSERQSLVGKGIHIKRNAWVGAGATILPGVTIGENSVVAAGAVVSHDVPDNVVVAGVPAKVIRELRQ